MNQEYFDFVKSAWSGIGDDKCHALIGLVGEFLELISATDKTNAIEELGDCVYYFAQLAIHHNLSPEDLATAELPEELEEPPLVTLLDAFKKKNFYNHDIDVTPAILIAYAEFRQEMVYAGFTMKDLCDSNRRKLETRYPSGKWCPEAAEKKVDHV